MNEEFPKLIKSEDFNSYNEFIESVYLKFKSDFIDDTVKFQGQKIAMKKHPMLSGKEITFWHLISSGNNEENKVPDTKRCEYVPWIKYLIINYQKYKYWENERVTRKGYKRRICIATNDFIYRVILETRPGYTLLWTAYPARNTRDIRKAEKEYLEYNKQESP